MKRYIAIAYLTSLALAVTGIGGYAVYYLVKAALAGDGGAQIVCAVFGWGILGIAIAMAYVWAIEEIDS